MEEDNAKGAPAQAWYHPHTYLKEPLSSRRLSMMQNLQHQEQQADKQADGQG